MDSNLRREFTPKVLTDLGINFNTTDKVYIALTTKNLLNVLPEWGFNAENAARTELFGDESLVKNQSKMITLTNVILKKPMIAITSVSWEPCLTYH